MWEHGKQLIWGAGMQLKWLMIALAAPCCPPLGPALINVEMGKQPINAEWMWMQNQRPHVLQRNHWDLEFCEEGTVNVSSKGNYSRPMCGGCCTCWGSSFGAVLFVTCVFCMCDNRCDETLWNMLVLAKLPSGISHSHERPRNKAGVKPFIVDYFVCSFSRADIFFNMLTQQI